jgi:hypothetical protein
MTCSKNFDRLLQTTCLGLIGMLVVAGCGGSSKSNADAKAPADGGPTDAIIVPPSPDGPAGAANLTLSAASVDLGSTDVAVPTAAKTVTVTNMGTKASGALTVTVTGTGISATGCSGTTLAPLATCIISITATEAAAGSISGSVSISEGTSVPKLVAVSGIATVPGQFSLTPSSLDLGKVLLKAAATGTVILTNNATTGLTGFVINVSSGTGFTQGAATTCTDSLPVGQTCNIVVSFTAATAGVATGSVIVSQGGVTKSVSLTATVQGPAKLAMTPATAALTATVGASSSPVTFYVTNSGDLPSGIPTAVLSGANAADFSISSNSCVTAIAGGATSSCQLNVVFSPKVMPATAGNETATLTVTDSGAGASSVTAALTGTPIPPSALALSGGPDSGNFGTVVVGATGTAYTLTLKNNGGDNSGAVTVATSDPEFVLLPVPADTCTGTDLKPAATCTFSLQFKPAAGAAGVVTARVTASAASTANPTAESITGTAVPPANLVASPTVLNFGSIPTLQESAPLTFTVTNNGGAPSGVLTLTNTGAQFAVKGDTCSGSTLAAAASCAVSVTFTATGTDTTGVEATGTVSVTDGKTTASVGLQGSGMNHPDVEMLPSVMCPQYTEDDPLCTASNANYLGRFPNKAVGHGTKAQTLTVTNYTDPTDAPDSGTLTFAITGDAAADFKIVQNNCTAALVSTSTHTTCVLTIAVTPSAVGLRKALLVLTTSRGGASQTTLEAKGLAPIEVQPLLVSKTKTGLDFGPVALGHDSAANDSLAYRVWVRDTTSADSNTTVTVTLPTANPADFVWPNDSVTFTITEMPDDVLTPPVPGGLGYLPLTNVPETRGGGGVNACSNKTVSLALGTDGNPTPAAVASNASVNYVFDGASGYWYCDFPVEFYPQSARGALSAVLTATGTTAGTSSLTLTGNASGPLVITPSPLLLSQPVAVGLGSSTSLTLTITNESATVTESGLSFALSGTGSGDFQIVGTDCWGDKGTAPVHAYSDLDQLLPGGVCYVWLGFEPKTQGGYSVTFTVTAANAGGTTVDSATDTVLSTGSQTFVGLTVTPASGTFVDTPFGATSATPVVFTVTNTGTLDTGPLYFALDTATDFEILSASGVAGACKDSGSGTGTVPGGGSCTIQVRPKPTSNPVGVGKRLIGNNLSVYAVPGGGVVVPLAYYETSSLMVNGQSSLAYDFGVAGVGTLVSHNFTISNVGGAPATLAFGDASPFTVDQTPVSGITVCTTNTLAAGASCILVVSGTPPVGVIGVQSKLPLVVSDSTVAGTPAPNSVKIYLSATTLPASKLVTYGIDPALTINLPLPDSGHPRIDLGTVPFGVGQGGYLTLWYQNVGGVATQPLNFRWDVTTPPGGRGGGVTTTGTAGEADPEFIIAGSELTQTSPCLGASVPPFGFCSVTLRFTPSTIDTTNTTVRNRQLVLLDTVTAPQVRLTARPLPAGGVAVSVRETSTTNSSEGFFQYTQKTSDSTVTVNPTTPEVHTFEIANGTASPATINIPATDTTGDFVFATGTTNGCTIGSATILNPAGTTGSTCQFKATFQSITGAAPVYPWTSVTLSSTNTPNTVLGLMGRTQQPVTLQVQQSPTSAACGLGCVDFLTVAVGGTAMQALTVVNTGDVAMPTPPTAGAAGLVTGYAAGAAGATWANTGCTGAYLTAYGTTGDRCVANVTATGVSLATATATFEVGVGAATTSPAATYDLQAEVLKAAHLILTGSTVFDATAVTSYSEQTFTITNGDDSTSYQTSGVVSIALSGGSGQFTVVGNATGTTCPPNVGLGSGEACTATVRFSPTALSPDGNAITSTLTATGATPGGGGAPALTIQGTPMSALTIAPIDSGTDSSPKFTMTGATQSFRVTIDDYAQATTDLKTGLTGTDAASFMIVDDQCYGQILVGHDVPTPGPYYCDLYVKYIGLATTTAKTTTLTVNGGAVATPNGQSASIVISYTGLAATVH